MNILLSLWIGNSHDNAKFYSKKRSEYLRDIYFKTVMDRATTILYCKIILL
jgi:hypothetical protein